MVVIPTLPRPCRILPTMSCYDISWALPIWEKGGVKKNNFKMLEHHNILEMLLFKGTNDYFYRQWNTLQNDTWNTLSLNQAIMETQALLFNISSATYFP